jgi:hypothetical protein
MAFRSVSDPSSGQFLHYRYDDDQYALNKNFSLQDD